MPSLVPALPLVKVAKVLDTMALSAALLDSLKVPVTSAIQKASLRLCTLLNTALASLETTDLFYVGKRTNGLDGYHLLLLSYGSLREDGTVTVQYADTRTGARTDVEDFLVDPIKGVIRVNSQECQDRFVYVSYTSGYQGEHEVPDEIEQAILCLVPLYMLSVNAAASEDGETKNTQPKAPQLEEMALSMVKAYMRRPGPVLKPLHSISVTYPAT